MSFLGAKLSLGHNKSQENLIVMQNSRLDSLEASMTKQATLPKEKMDALEKSMETGSKACDEGRRGDGEGPCGH